MWQLFFIILHTSVSLSRKNEKQIGDQFDTQEPNSQ